jgi:hydroxymethylbilane synthase
LSNKLLKPSSIEVKMISTGARSSPLSRVQVEEAQSEIQNHFPEIRLDPIWLETTGDKDLKTSLRNLDKTDFFTKEIDQLILTGQCRIGVHSAKDLPSPLPKGLRIIAITQGIDSSDSLVFRDGESLNTLPPGAKIAASSERREESVREFRPDLKFIDLRGNIGQRLVKLEEGAADGVVIAEAALIRLKLTHLPRIKLPGETALGQGQLAIVAREDDDEAAAIFKKIDIRPSALYLGLNPPQDDLTTKFLPFPIIKIVPRSFESSTIKEVFLNLAKATHVIFTSQSTVSIFFDALNIYGIPISVLNGKKTIAIGEKTATCLAQKGVMADLTPKIDTTEGIICDLDKLDLHHPRFFWPHSSLSRPLLKEYFNLKQFAFDEAILYDTIPSLPGTLPSLDDFEQIIFTSPSTVDAFLKFFGSFPQDKTLKAIGPVTAKYLIELT